MKKILRFAVYLILISIICFSGYKIWEINNEYVKEVRLHDILLEYKPRLTELSEEVVPPAENAGNPENEPIPEDITPEPVNLWEKYPDLIGWVTISNTHIDYPFVFAKDNEEYLRRNIDGDYAYAGTIFMDYRNRKSFDDPYIIIHGHNMKNSSMFGDLKKFKNDKFWEENQSGYILTRNKKYELSLVAFLTVKSDDQIIYRINDTEEKRAELLKYMSENATHYRGSDLSAGERYIVLSTCSYDFDGARMALVCKIAG